MGGFSCALGFTLRQYTGIDHTTDRVHSNQSNPVFTVHITLIECWFKMAEPSPQRRRTHVDFDEKTTTDH